MTTNTTLAAKLQAVTDNETRLLAAIQGNRSQAKSLDDQFKQFEEQRHVFAGAKLILQELQNEAPTEATTELAPCTDAGCCGNVEPLPTQNS